MKNDRSDPPRIHEEGPEAIRELVRSRRRGPSDAAVAEMSKRLAAAGILASPVSPSPGARSATTTGYYKLGVVLVVAGGLLLTWRATQQQQPAGLAPNVALAPAIPTAPTTPARSVAVEPPDDPAVTAIPVGELPSVRAPAPAVPEGAGGTSVKPAPPPPPATELELVQRAQAALASDPDRVLGITSEHARAYPQGELVQEREVLAVEALSRLGRNDEAIRRSRALVQRYPRTPYAARLEKAIGQPLSPTSNPAKDAIP